MSVSTALLDEADNCFRQHLWMVRRGREGALRMTAYVISSGVTSSYELLPKDTLRVLTDGVSDGSTVSSAAHEYVGSGAVSEGDTVLAGGVLVISAGATAQSDTVYGVLSGAGVLQGYTYDDGLVEGVALGAGQAMDVYGTTSAVSILSGAELNVSSGGLTLHDQVQSDGLVIVFSGGTASGTVISAGGTEIFSAGATAKAVIVSSGGEAELSATLSNGQTITLQSGGSPVEALDGVSLRAGALLDLTGATVEAGAILSVGAGAVASNVVVSAGGELVGAGAIANDFDYNVYSYTSTLDYGAVSGVSVGDHNGDFGTLVVESGGSADGVTLISGSVDVLSSGVLSDANFDGTAEVFVESGGHATSVTLNGYSDKLVVSAGAVATATVVQGTAEYYYSDINYNEVYGSAVDTTVSALGEEEVQVGGVSLSAIVLSEGTQQISSGGEAISASVLAGGTQHLLSGGKSMGTHVASGGVFALDAGGAATGAVVSSGGTLELDVVVSSGQTYVVPPAAASANSLVSGVSLRIGALTQLVGATVLNSGVLSVGAGRSIQDLTVFSGARVNGPGILLGESYDAGLVSGVVLGEVAGVSGYLNVSSGGVASSVTVVDGELSLIGGSAQGTIVDGAGEVYVYGGSVATDTVLAGSGSTEVDYQGSSISTTISSGATQTVEYGGYAGDARVSAGGRQSAIEATVSDTTVLAGGLEVLADSTAEGVVVLSGGAFQLTTVVTSGESLTIPAGASTSSTTILGVTLRAGASFSFQGGEVQSGGRLTLASGASGGDETIDQGGELDGPGVLLSYTDDYGLISGATLTSGSNLYIANNGSAVGLNELGGSVDTDDAVVSAAKVRGGNLDIYGSTDSASTIGGGPFSANETIEDSIATSDRISSGGVQSVTIGGSANLTTVVAGGEQLVLSGGSISGTTVLAGGELVVSNGASAAGTVIGSGGALAIDLTLSSGQHFTDPASPLSVGVSIDGITLEAGATLDIVSAAVVSTAVLTLGAGALAKGVSVASGGRLNGPGELEGQLAQANQDFGLVSGINLGDAATAAMLQIESGGSASAVTVVNGVLAVSSGGAARTTTVGAAGELIASAGASFLSAHVVKGGVLVSMDGAALSGATVSAGAELVLSGATLAAGTKAPSGPVTAAVRLSGALVSSGAVVNYDDATLLSGATLDIEAGGSAATVFVSFGAVVSGPGLLKGESADAGSVAGVTLAGDLGVVGTATSVRVGDAVGDPGQLTVSSGGVANASVLVSGGVNVLSGGATSATQVGSGAELHVSSGGLTRATIVSAGGDLVVDFGGIDSSSKVLSGGTESLFAGTAVGVVVSSGGAVYLGAVFSSGQSFTAQANLLSSQITLDGVTARIGATFTLDDCGVLSGAVLSLGSGAEVIAASIAAGGVVTGPGSLEGYNFNAGLISGVTIGTSDAFGYVFVQSGGEAEDLSLVEGFVEIESGASATNISPDGPASLQVDLGGVATHVSGALVVDDSGVTSTLFLVGGIEYDGGLAVSTTVAGSGAALGGQEVYGGVASHTIVSSGAVQLVEYGSAVSTTVLSGGYLDDLLGSVSAARVSSGAHFELEGGIVSQGQSLTVGVVTAAETISGAMLLSGVTLVYDGADVRSGGMLSFGSDGIASELIVESGALVSGPGVLVNDSLVSGGSLADVTLGEVSVGLGALTISGGVASDVQVTSGSYVAVVSGAANGTILSSGAEQDVFAGTTASSGEVLSGGYEYIEAGAVGSGTTVSKGGDIEFALGGVAAGEVLVDGTLSAAMNVSGVHLVAGALLDYGEYTVSSGGTISVTAGGDADAITVLAGGALTGSGSLIDYTQDFGLVAGVSVGNVASGLQGGIAVESGGVASGLDLASDAYGQITVASGGLLEGAKIAGGVEVSSGGTDSGSTVLSGGSETLDAGATATGVSVSSGGVAYIGLTLTSGQTFTYSSALALKAVTLDGVTVRAGGVLELQGVLVESGGLLSVASTATVASATVAAGGVLSGAGDLGGLTSDYGLVSGVHVVDSGYYGGELYVESGGGAGNVTLDASQMEILSGGVVSGTLASAYCYISVDGGGANLNTTLYGGGERVQGLSVDTQIYAQAYQEVESGGMGNDAVVFSGGKQMLDVGAAAAGTTVLSGGDELISSGTSVAAVTVSSGGRVEFYGGELVAGLTLSDGPAAAVSALNGVTVSAGGVIDYGGYLIDSGATLALTAGGTAEALTVSLGGVVSGAGVLSGNASDAGEIDSATMVAGRLYQLGVTSDLRVGSSGVQLVSSGAAATSGVVLSGGMQQVLSSGLATSTAVSAGGEQIVASGGTAAGVKVSSGGLELISAGATVTGVVISAGATAEVGVLVGTGQSYTLPAAPVTATARFGGVTVLAGGALQLTSATVASGGALTLASGATAAEATVSSGGMLSGLGVVTSQLVVYGGAKLSGVGVGSGAGFDLIGGVVSSGTSLTVGAAVVATTISGADVETGATVTLSGGLVSSGGHLTVAAGGSAYDVTAITGAVVVADGDLTYDVTSTITLGGALQGAGDIEIQGGGRVVRSGVTTTFSGVATIGYGTLELGGASGLGSATIALEARDDGVVAATLQIDAADTPANGGTFVNALQDFADSSDAVDLSGVAYSASASATLAGDVLTLVDGARTLHFDLTGATATSYSVSADGATGTLIAGVGYGRQQEVAGATTAASAGGGRAQGAQSALPGAASTQTGGSLGLLGSLAGTSSESNPAPTSRTIDGQQIGNEASSGSVPNGGRGIPNGGATAALIGASAAFGSQGAFSADQKSQAGHAGPPPSLLGDDAHKGFKVRTDL